MALDRDRARFEAERLAEFQSAETDPQVAGGFWFGRKGEEMLPFINPVSTGFGLQALAMWNDVFVAHYAERFAERIESLASTPQDRLNLAYELALGRLPTATELPELTAYSGKHGLANLCRVILNSNEFVFVN